MDPELIDEWIAYKDQKKMLDWNKEHKTPMYYQYEIYLDDCKRAYESREE